MIPPDARGPRSLVRNFVRPLSALLPALLLLPGCPAEKHEAPAPPPPAAAPSVPAAAAPAAHDPAHPPIDCPLRKQGIHVDHLRPFEDVAKYIAFLERPERDAWQKPDEVVAALGLRGDEVVADLGAGSGYFSFRFAKALPRGRVVARDIEPEMVRHVHHRATTEGLANVQALLGRPDDPGVPPDTNLVFVCDVLHHVTDRPAWLRKLASQLRKGARLALIEFKERPLPYGPPEGVKLPRARLLQLVTAAGLALRDEKPDLLPYQTFLVFEKP